MCCIFLCVSLFTVDLAGLHLGDIQNLIKITLEKKEQVQSWQDCVTALFVPSANSLD